jgi:hypothetical protein
MVESVKGLDYAWGYPGVPTLKKGGYEFVMRYLSHTPAKNLKRWEAEELSKAGIWIGVVWETTADRAGSGKTAGVRDAMTALSQARELGMPDDRPIYFAVDWDAHPSDDRAIWAYLDGCAAILGRSRVGMYAGYGPIKRAFDAGKIEFGWQTYAWSHKKWDARAHIQQYSNGHTVGGTDCDYNRLGKDVTDFGQWMHGKVPDMLSNDDKKWLQNLVETTVKAEVLNVWSADMCPAPDGWDNSDNPNWQFRNVVRMAASEGHAANAKLDTILTAMGEVEEQPPV